MKLKILCIFTQEVPKEMMQAAMTAINNRNKVNSIDRAKSKGKAPRPPSRNGNDEPTDHVDHITVNMESGETLQICTMNINTEENQPDLGECVIKH